MSDQLYSEALQNVQKRLSNPRTLTTHAILFSMVSMVAALQNYTVYTYILGTTYWAIFFWCLALAAHGVYEYHRSGLSKDAREKAIQAELLSLTNTYNLTTDELVDLHERLSEDVAQRAQPLRWAAATISGYTTLWVGLLMAGVMINSFMAGMFLSDRFTLLVQIAPFVGTSVLGFVLIIASFLGRRAAEDHDVREAYLRALYNTKLEKSKRIATERLMVDDEGEIILERAEQRKRG